MARQKLSALSDQPHVSSPNTHAYQLHISSPTFMLISSTYRHQHSCLSAPYIVTNIHAYQLHISSPTLMLISSTYRHPTLMLISSTYRHPTLMLISSTYRHPTLMLISSTYRHPTFMLISSRCHPFLLSCNSSRADKRKSDAPDSFECSPHPSNGAAVKHDKGHVPNKGAKLAFPSSDASLKHDGVYPQGFSSIVGLIKFLYRSLHVKLFELNVNWNGYYVF